MIYFGPISFPIAVLFRKPGNAANDAIPQFPPAIWQDFSTGSFGFAFPDVSLEEIFSYFCGNILLGIIHISLDYNTHFVVRAGGH